MTSLRERFEELADRDTPLSRLTYDDIRVAAGRRRWNRAAAAVAGGLSVAVVAAAVVLSTGPRPESLPPGATVSPTDNNRNRYDDGGIFQAVATDADHLYAKQTRCPTPESCGIDLVGSDDGGRTWTLRKRHGGLPGKLWSTPSGRLTLRDGSTVSTSVDGGRTWTTVTTRTDSTPVQTVADDGWLDCRFGEGPKCLLAYTPDGASRAPLANQPNLENVGVFDVPAAAGLWVVGDDPATGRKSISTSHDSGRTWSPTFVPGAELPGDRRVDYQLTTVDGRTAYLISRTLPLAPPPDPSPGTCCNYSGSMVRIDRTDDGGLSWRRVDPRHTVPLTWAWTYLAADGSHMVQEADRSTKWWRSHDGGASYQPTAEVRGLPRELGFETGRAVIAVAPGVYLAYNTEGVYRSADGFTWTRIPVSVR
jgi:hypothetical protein